MDGRGSGNDANNESREKTVSLAFKVMNLKHRLALYRGSLRYTFQAAFDAKAAEEQASADFVQLTFDERGHYREQRDGDWRALRATICKRLGMQVKFMPVRLYST